MFLHLHILTTLLIAMTALTSAAHLTFTIPPSTHLSNPSTLPATTRATLFCINSTLVAPLTRYNGFDFKNVAPGSYLFTVQCRDFLFAPLRVDVVSDAEHGPESKKGKIDVWQTFWGNEWGNKGERRGGGFWKEGSERIVVEVRPEGGREYYLQRAGFDPMSFLKNPMILMAIVSLVLIVGMPYLTEGMDEETKKEYEELQENSPLFGGGALKSETAQAVQNFDFASWMAGKK